MPYSTTVYTGDGTNRTFPVPFPYLDKAHVRVSVAGVIQAGVLFLTAGMVQLAVAPAAGVPVEVSRQTPLDSIVTFVDASTLTATDENTATVQALYAVAEAGDTANRSANLVQTTANQALAVAEAARNTANLLASGSTVSTRAPAGTYSSILTGYGRAWTDMRGHFWNGAATTPHIVALAAGYQIADGSGGTPTTFWQMCCYANVLYWEWRVRGNQSAREMLRNNAAWLRQGYTGAQLASADNTVTGGVSNNRSIINSQDDASLAVEFWRQVHDATGDDAALNTLKTLVTSAYTFFHDPNNSGAGLLYATAAQDPGHQKMSQIIEALTARGALYCYHRTGEAPYLAYAVGTWTWIDQYLKAPAPFAGCHFCELILDPASSRYRMPYLGSAAGFETMRGSSLGYLAGEMWFGSLSAALYQETGEQKYLDALNALVTGMTQRNTYARVGTPVGQAGDVFVNDRDAWSDGLAAPLFVDDALALAGVDASGTWKAVLRNTARAIIAQRTSDGYYGADWSGPEFEISNTYNTWVAQAGNGGGGSGSGMAVPGQVMTSASSVSILQAAALLDRWDQRR